MNSSTTPKSVGLINDQFVECPETPNCISSMSDLEGHQIEAIPYTENFDFVRDRFTILFHQYENATLVSSDSTYFHFEFRTFPLAFTDDVEILFDTSAKLIHLKSASRLGYTDFGTNRRRLNSIIEKYKTIE